MAGQKIRNPKSEPEKLESEKFEPQSGFQPTVLEIITGNSDFGPWHPKYPIYTKKIGQPISPSMLVHCIFCSPAHHQHQASKPNPNPTPCPQAPDGQTRLARRPDPAPSQSQPRAAPPPPTLAPAAHRATPARATERAAERVRLARASPGGRGAISAQEPRHGCEQAAARAAGETEQAEHAWVAMSRGSSTTD